MIVKVCGMREAQNVADVCSLRVDMMGFILYDRSPRFVDCVAPSTTEGVKRVGVFVNATIEYILDMAKKHSLHVAQLHGSESVELCQAIRTEGLKVIKAISIATKEDMRAATPFVNKVDYLLFDTKCAEHGGSGRSFDWSILDSYSGETPFLLSGGINEESAEAIRTLRKDSFAGIDLNSRFEVSPALKDIMKLKKFIKQLKDE